MAVPVIPIAIGLGGAVAVARVAKWIRDRRRRRRSKPISLYRVAAVRVTGILYLREAAPEFRAHRPRVARSIPEARVVKRSVNSPNRQPAYRLGPMTANATFGALCGPLATPTKRLLG